MTGTDRRRFSLVGWNRRLWNDGLGGMLAALVFLGAMAAYALPEALRGDLPRPPDVGDGPDYDNIAWALVRGEGFAHHWGNRQYLEPYMEANADGRYDYLLTRQGAGPTAYRPPLLPLLMAGTYRVWGRQFVAVRLLNAAAVGLWALLVLMTDEGNRFRAMLATPLAGQARRVDIPSPQRLDSMTRL